MPNPKKLTVRQVRKGYDVALAALRAIATTIPASQTKVCAADVVKNIDNGNFLK